MISFEITLHKMFFSFSSTEQQELALLHCQWMLRRTKDKILHELPKKGLHYIQLQQTIER